MNRNILKLFFFVVLLLLLPNMMMAQTDVVRRKPTTSSSTTKPRTNTPAKKTAPKKKTKTQATTRSSELDAIVKATMEWVDAMIAADAAEEASKAADEDNNVYEVVDVEPSFPDGKDALLSWLSSNIHYPAVAEEYGIQGSVVMSFIVEKDGSISNVLVEHGVEPSLDEESERVVKSMPRWTPGKRNGQVVRVKYNVPVTFKLSSALPRATSSTSSGSSLQNITITANGVTFTMVAVPGGTFIMGATSEQVSDAYDEEKPAHRVTLSDYYIGQTEVTQALWQAVMGSNPSNWKGSDLPVEKVSCIDCQQFITKLNQITGRRFRLPTEAEWEYAARGGSRSRGYKYAGSNDIGSVAWYDGNSGGKTHSVGQKQANELDIYDMSGNVWEWCQDWYDEKFYGKSPSTNPCNNTSASYRVCRGGSWNFNARHCRESGRGGWQPIDCSNDYLGLRLAM